MAHTLLSQLAITGAQENVQRKIRPNSMPQPALSGHPQPWTNRECTHLFGILNKFHSSIDDVFLRYPIIFGFAGMTASLFIIALSLISLLY
jgi:hypothetical protein